MKLKFRIFIKISAVMLKQDSIPATSIKITHLVYQPLRMKKVIGMMKDEGTCKIITEFVGLRPKTNHVRRNGEVYKKCKGVKTNTKTA